MLWPSWKDRFCTMCVHVSPSERDRITISATVYAILFHNKCTHRHYLVCFVIQRQKIQLIQLFSCALHRIN